LSAVTLSHPKKGPFATTAQFCKAGRLGQTRMPRPMTILIGGRQSGQKVSRDPRAERLTGCRRRRRRSTMISFPRIVTADTRPFSLTRSSLFVMSGGPGKTGQAHHDRYCPNDSPLALAAHSRTLNDFGSLEYEYRSDRTEHNPKARSYPHRWLRSRRHKDREDCVASPADGSPGGQPSLVIRLGHRYGLPNCHFPETRETARSRTIGCH